MSRVVVVTPSFLPSWGGAERLIYEVARRLARNHDVTVLSPHPPAEAFNEYADALRRDAPIRSVQYNAWGRLDRLRGRRLHRGVVPPVDLSAFIATVRELRTRPADAVLAFYAVPTGFGAVAAAKLLRTRSTLAFIGRDVPGPGVPGPWRWYTRWLARRCDHIVFISRYCQEALFPQVSTRPKSASIIGGGVDRLNRATSADAELLRQRLGISPEERIVLSVQRLSDYKGVDVLLRSMRELHDLSCRLVVVGSGAQLASLKQLAASLGLVDQVLFLGFVPEDQMPTVWKAADVFAFHSFYETFGLAVAEAMAAQLPVIAPRSTALVDLIDDGNTGLLVEPGNPTAMADAIRKILNDSSLAARLASAALTATQAFDWELIAAEYERSLFATDETIA